MTGPLQPLPLPRLGEAPRVPVSPQGMAHPAAPAHAAAPGWDIAAGPGRGCPVSPFTKRQRRAARCSGAGLWVAATQLSPGQTQTVLDVAPQRSTALRNSQEFSLKCDNCPIGPDATWLTTAEDSVRRSIPLCPKSAAARGMQPSRSRHHCHVLPPCPELGQTTSHARECTALTGAAAAAVLRKVRLSLQPEGTRQLLLLGRYNL
ncbi:hypothetical protein Anapl_06266 [Anas platyrhynchos]|uniref:Uncharacterized protein n=1 Tax=Anas platyrhynchos TaxID=8839 RepID=R0LRA7_ANAPL|nr:hypothetical protein Anapl_06266 [Anas platyrhynchos]